MLERLPGAVDVGIAAAREAADGGPVHGRGDITHALEVSRRSDRETRLDDVDAECHERLRDLHLLGEIHARTGRLLAVTERGVEDADGPGRRHGNAKKGWCNAEKSDSGKTVSVSCFAGLV